MAANSYYIAVACPELGMLQIIDHNSGYEICTVRARANTTLGDSLGFDEVTLFVSGLHRDSNLHFVTQIHILQSKIDQKFRCAFIDNETEYVVSHTLSPGYSSS